MDVELKMEEETLEVEEGGALEAAEEAALEVEEGLVKRNAEE